MTNLINRIYDFAQGAITEQVGTNSNRQDVYGGAVDAQSVATKEQPVVNVAAYGAVGDGATDDTQAVNDAISAAPDGSVLYFPRTGSGYIVSSIITHAKALEWDMGRPQVDQFGAISGAYLKQADGANLSSIVKPSSAINVSGQINVHGNRANNTTDVTGVEVDTQTVKHYRIGGVECDTVAHVYDDAENCRVEVFAAESGTALLDGTSGQQQSQDECRYYVNAHNVNKGFVSDGDPNTGGGKSVISAEVSVEQCEYGVDLIADCSLTLVAPKIRGADSEALRTQNGVNVTVQGGTLQSRSANSIEAIATNDGSIARLFGTRIESNTYEARQFDTSTYIAHGCAHSQGRRIADPDSGATAIIRDPAYIGTNADRTLNGFGEVYAELTAAQVRDADFSNNASNSRIVVTTPVSDTERADIDISTGYYTIFNSDQNRHQYGVGGSWTEPTTQSA